MSILNVKFLFLVFSKKVKKLHKFLMNRINRILEENMCDIIVSWNTQFSSRDKIATIELYKSFSENAIESKSDTHSW